MNPPAMRQRIQPCRARRQRGVAVITALLLTTLAVTIVSSLFWQQQVQVRSMENQRLHLQTKWILRGVLDFGRLILTKSSTDARGLTTLDGVWATPLAETRLDDFVERERVAGDQGGPTMAGQMSDAQARYNLANLSVGKIIKQGQVQVFRRLLTNLQLDPSLAQPVAEAMARTQIAAAAGLSDGDQSASQSDEPIAFIRVEDLLSVPGFTPETVERLREFVILLPKPTPVNVNTTSAEVMSAVVDNFSVAEAEALIYRFKHSYFLNDAAFIAALELQGKKLIDGVQVVVKSDYFLAASQIRYDRAALDTQSLIARSNRSMMSLISIREN
jgi:general secretion pathway protein K